MAEKLYCPECDARIKVPPVPRKINCPECDFRFHSDDAEWPGGGKPSKPVKNPMLILGIVGGALVLVVIIGVAVWMGTRRAPKADDDQEFVANLPQQPFKQNPPPNPVPKKSWEDPVRKLPGTSNVPWAVTSDGIPRNVERLPSDAKWKIPLADSPGSIAFPAFHSSFVCVAPKDQPGVRLIVHLPTGVHDSRVVLGKEPDKRVVMSPDRAWIATLDGSALRVRETRRSEVVSTVTPTDGPADQIDYEILVGSRLLVGGSRGEECEYQVYWLNGTLVHKFKVDGVADHRTRAISAGGNFLAIPNRKQDRVMIYDLRTGKLAGEAMFREPVAEGIQGLGFTLDGKQLGGIYEHKNKTCTIAWDIKTGNREFEGSTGINMRLEMPNQAKYSGPVLDFIRDRESWLLYGRWMVLPRNPTRMGIADQPNPAMATRFFDYHRVVRYADGNIVIQEAPENPFDTSGTPPVAQGGKDPAEPPPKPKVPTTNADFSQSKEVKPGGTGWKFQPAAPAAAKINYKKPVTLNGQTVDLSQLLFSSASAGRAVVIRVEKKAPTRAVADIYDLAAGERLGTLTLFEINLNKHGAQSVKGGLSPDGSHLAVLNPVFSRIEVWNIKDEKLLHAFNASSIWPPTATGFIDDQRFWTLSKTQLAVWDLASGKPVWRMGDITAPPAVSPDLKHLLIGGAGLDVYEAATGTHVGTLGGLVFKSVELVTFRPDSRQIGAIVQGDDGLRFAKWDAAGGKLLRNFPVRDALYSLNLIDDEYMVLSSSIYDLKHGLPVSFPVGVGLTAGPDNRFWFADVSKLNPRQTTLPLGAKTLPDAEARRISGLLTSGAVRPVLVPGMTVSVTVNCLSAPADERKKILERFTKDLQQQGFKVADTAGVNFLVDIGVPAATGKTETYTYKDRSKGMFTLNHVAVDQRVDIRDSFGILTTETNNVHTTGFANEIIVMPGDNLQQKVNDAVILRAAQTLRVPAHHAYIARSQQGVMKLPMTTVLVPDK